MTAIPTGTVLAGKYRVTKVLGEGGMGVVVAAVHLQLDEPVALKFMLPNALGSPEAVERFLREARAAVKLKSEHVARVSDVGTLENGAPYIVMEYLEGTDLSGVLAARGPLPPADAVDYIVQACDALAEAHSLGIVHRDLKPANLFLTQRRDGSPLVKVLDFGISKASTLNEQSSGNLTKTGDLMGSPTYMSPEQMKSSRDTDARTDVWALGVILYELLGGRPPFDADTLGGLMAQVFAEPPKPLASVRPGLPPALYAAIDRCLQKDRNTRWGSVAELVMALRPIAPPRVHPLIDRITALLAPSMLTNTIVESSIAQSPASPTGVGVTAPGWAEKSGAPQPMGSGKRGAAIAGALALTCALIVGGVAVMRGSRSVPAAATTVATATAPSPPPEIAPSAAVDLRAPTPAPTPAATAAASASADPVVPDAPSVAKTPAAPRNNGKKTPAARASATAPAAAASPVPHPAAKPTTDPFETSN